MSEFPETSVDGEVIDRLARHYGMGAGGLKGILLGDPDPEDTPYPKAVEHAYREQKKHHQEEA